MKIALGCAIRCPFFLILLLLFTGRAAADETTMLPLWELGVMGGVVDWPYYDGAKEHYRIPLLLPYFIYRSDRVQADRQGLRGVLFKGESLLIDIGISGGPPVISGSQGVRSGMQDIPLTGEIGPRLQLRLYQFSRQVSLRLRVPVRAVIDQYGKNHGWTSEPNLILSDDAINDRWGSFLSVATLYASQEYNNLYFGVSPADAREGREEYAPTNGLVGFFATIGAKYLYSDKITIGTFFQGRWLGKEGAAGKSPLVERRNDYAAGLWFSWSIISSKEKRVAHHILEDPE